MTQAKLFEQVVDLLRFELSLSCDQAVAVDMSTKLEEDLGADSLTRLELTWEIEDRFEVSIPADTSFTTVGDIVRCLEELF